jgi:hypothetical protein
MPNENTSERAPSRVILFGEAGAYASIAPELGREMPVDDAVFIRVRERFAGLNHNADTVLNGRLAAIQDDAPIS